MKALPTQDRALKKRAALLTAAVKEFSSVGFDLATAKSIATVAGVATGTFYQYFENKNDILCVLAMERFDYLQESIRILELQSVVDDDVALRIEDSIESTLNFLFDFHSSEPQLHQVLEQRRVTDPKLKKIMRDGEAVLEARVLAFVKTFNMPNPEVVADNIFAMGEGIVHRQVFGDTNTDPQQAIRLGAKMIASFFKE